MSLLAHSVACAHFSDAPRFGRTMEAMDMEAHENCQLTGLVFFDSQVGHRAPLARPQPRENPV